MEKNNLQNGWIAVARSLKDKGYYQNSMYVHLWVHLLLSVNSSVKEFMWNGKIIKINKGQFVTGRKKLSQDTGIPETTIERCLGIFEKEGQIGQQKTTKYRLITILNWDKFQKTDSKRTANGQQTDTNNNNYNNNNNNNIEREAEASPTPKDNAMFFFKGIKDFLEKRETEEAKAMGGLLKKMSLEQGIESPDRKKKFWEEVVKFGDYWQEKDHLGKREKWQMQKTFEVDKRLVTWLKRAGQWSRENNYKSKKTPNYVL